MLWKEVKHWLRVHVVRFNSAWAVLKFLFPVMCSYNFENLSFAIRWPHTHSTHFLAKERETQQQETERDSDREYHRLGMISSIVARNS
jgi:hypothetical protein